MGIDLALSDVAKHFGATLALDGVNLALRTGSVHALIGENGAGKSTLMNVISGTITPDRGTMQVNGKPYRPDSPAVARLNGIAQIHQELSLFPHLSVTENILMGIEPSRHGLIDKQAARDRALKVLEGFAHPEIRPERRVADLPLAAWQVVEISRALAANARIILMDEPTSSLGRADVERLFDLIRHLRSEGISIIYISHFLEEVREIADDFTVLRDGRSVDTGSIAKVTDNELVSAMVGRSVEAIFPVRPDSKVGEVLLEVRGLSAPPALQHAEFELRRGEILGIAGLVGSGRTDLVRTLFGLKKAKAGLYRLSAESAVALNPLSRGMPTQRISEGFGYLSEDRKGEGLGLALSIADNTTLTRLSTCSRFGWLNLKRQENQTAELIAQLGIKARSPIVPVKTLSGGNQQKVALARLLHQRAEVLLLDEPTRGIDIGSKVQVYEQIVQCAAAGKAILLVSSYLPELFGICDRLAVMRRGRLSSAKPISEWTPESVMQAAISGL
ncbi:MAG: ribose transport system ATP-binding protein [Blastocatellia bacterium]|nr:ribose transport system ATP-binding protein [Blastocatellia bacterium]